jgi:hypothetical protein
MTLDQNWVRSSYAGQSCIDQQYYDQYKQNLPNFRQMVEQGRSPLPPNPYTRFEILYNWPLGPILDKIGNARDKSCDVSFEFVDSFDDARSHYFSLLSNSSLDVSVATLEAPKTFRMIAERASQIAQTFIHLKRFEVGKAIDTMFHGKPRPSRHEKRLRRDSKRFRKEWFKKHGSNINESTDWAASHWLELKYGWTPFLMDVENGIEAMARDWGSTPSDIRVAARGRKTGKAIVSLGSYMAGSATGSLEHKTRIVTYHTVLDVSARNSNALGLKNVGSTAWELVPYSFVVDWFLPIGNWIKSQTAASGLGFVHGTSATIQTFNGFGTFTGDQIGPLFAYKRGYWYTRSVITEFPAPRLNFDRDDLNKMYSWDRVMTSLSLLKVAFSGKKTPRQSIFVDGRNPNFQDTPYKKRRRSSKKKVDVTST